MINVNVRALALLCQAHRVLDHRKSAKAQKIHFQKAQLLNGSHGELGGDGAIRRPGQGHKLIDGAAADHYPRRVDGGMPGQSLQTPCHVDEVVYLGVFLIGFL